MALSKEYILSQISEEDIFQKYFGQFKLKKMYKSPLRDDDDTPSFNIYKTPSGRLYFKDFGGEFGDCFDFVCEDQGVDFRGALGIIAQDFQLLNKTDVKVYRGKRRESIPYVEIVTSRLHFDYRAKPFPYFGQQIDFWAEGGITLEVLEEYNTRNVEWFTYINKNNRKIVHRAKLFDPIYAYEYGDGVVRFYRPKAKDKRLKWAGNTRFCDIFGLDQIKERVPVCGILAGQKDSMAQWANIGIRAVCTASESTWLTAEAFERIQAKSDKQFVLYDNDPPSKQYPEGQGLHFAKKISKEYGIPALDYRDITTQKDTFAYFKHIIKTGEREQLSALIYSSV